MSSPFHSIAELVPNSAFIDSNTTLGLSIHYKWGYIRYWISLASLLASDLGDLILATFFCKALAGMENDVRVFSRAATWAHRTVYLIGGVLAASSAVRLIALPRDTWFYPWPLWWWASNVFACVYLFAVLAMFGVAVILKRRYNPCNKQEYIVGQVSLFPRAVANGSNRYRFGPH